MENNLFEQIKKAESNAESHEFPGMDSVWSRVENKLDNKVLVKQNRKWKQWAVAASVLLVASLGYQVYRTELVPEQKIEVLKIKEILPVNEPMQIIADADEIKDTTIIRKDAPTILRNAIRSSTVTMAEEDDANQSPVTVYIVDSVEGVLVPEAPLYDEKDVNADAGFVASKAKREKGKFTKGQIFPARSVRHDSFEVPTEELKKGRNHSERKGKPLLIIDGNPVVAKSQTEYDEKIAELENGGVRLDTIIHLKKPLYVINGVEYSEESLFGAKPTSPYAPLNLQEEGMTTTILTGRKAESAYGVKGRNGVVIITTKNGRPAPKK